MTVKRLENLLNSNKDGDLGAIVQHAQEMVALASALARAAGPEDGASIVAANVREDGELVVVVRSPAWASRLRFATDALLDAARAHGAAVEHCTIRVARPD